MTAYPKTAPGLMDVTLGTYDLGRATRFYDAVMVTAGLASLPDAPTGFAGWGPVQGTGLWLCQPFNGLPATHGNGAMITLRAQNAAQNPLMAPRSTSPMSATPMATNLPAPLPPMTPQRTNHERRPLPAPHDRHA
jgi:hypothetical protein